MAIDKRYGKAEYKKVIKDDKRNANAAKVKVPVHYTAVYRTQYAKNSSTHQVEAGRAKRAIQGLLAFTLLFTIAFVVIVAALLTN
ncbi:hypothetical protein AHiyo6_00360 [Arthrobacter sp. Hiyo6]|nr:hypothetical protein AHiyo6_00360 [Arthrobacter sp. Hiyo6]